VLDVLPTVEVWERADAQFALGFWPWSLLAQPEALPERLVAAAPEAIVEHALDRWARPESELEIALANGGLVRIRGDVAL
jgi:haloacetate dehalogenase